jgi:glucose dehydrogenase
MANGRGGWYAGFLEVGMWLLFVALLVPAVLVGYVIGQDRSEGEGTVTVTVSQAQAAEAERKAIKGAPAFSTDDLAKDPEDAWITNGGSLSNQRYSPLDEIDTGNVKELKGVWMTTCADRPRQPSIPPRRSRSSTRVSCTSRPARTRSSPSA